MSVPQHIMATAYSHIATSLRARGIYAPVRRSHATQEVLGNSPLRSAGSSDASRNRQGADAASTIRVSTTDRPLMKVSMYVKLRELPLDSSSTMAALQSWESGCAVSESFSLTLRVAWCTLVRRTCFWQMGSVPSSPSTPHGHSPNSVSSDVSMSTAIKCSRDSEPSTLTARPSKPEDKSCRTLQPQR